MVEHQTKELRVVRPEVLKTAGKADVAIISIVCQILNNFVPDGFLQRLDDVGRSFPILEGGLEHPMHDSPFSLGLRPHG